MSTITTESSYDNDLLTAQTLMDKFVDPDQCAGNGRNWIDDMLNDAWSDGISIEAWVAKAATYIPVGFRRSAT